jgi:hypothetical protein
MFCRDIIAVLLTVIFKSERILPVAFVSFQRRRKTLLWLDDFPESQESLRVRSEIPGAKWFDELEATEQKHVILMVGNPTRSDGVSSVCIMGATGHFAAAVNGLYQPTSERENDRPVYRKRVDEQAAGLSAVMPAVGNSMSGVASKSVEMLIMYNSSRKEWHVKDEHHRGNDGWYLASVAGSDSLELCTKSIWKVVSVPQKSDRISFMLNSAATDFRRNPESYVSGEDEVDFTLFTSVSAIVSFLSDSNNQKFANYPPSLFRIIANPRLFTGSVPVSVHNDTEFSCKGISSLMAPGDRIVFEGQQYGGVEGGHMYYLVAIRKGKDCEYFSVSKQLGGDVMRLQRGSSQSLMFACAPLKSLQHFFETSDTWRLSFPATCVYGEREDDMQALSGRPNCVATNKESECTTFVQFEPILQSARTSNGTFTFLLHLKYCYRTLTLWVVLGIYAFSTQGIESSPSTILHNPSIEAHSRFVFAPVQKLLFNFPRSL